MSDFAAWCALIFVAVYIVVWAATRRQARGRHRSPGPRPTDKEN